MSQHSHRAVMAEFDVHNNNDNNNTTTAANTMMLRRRYAIGYYSCPLQAGNRLHHFFNSLIWSIVTNRTMLWRYYDQKACKRIGRRNDPNICRTANRVHVCNKVLKRASWIPSATEWYPKLINLSYEILSFWSTIPKSTKHKFWKDGSERYAGIADTTNSTIVEFAQMLGQDSIVLRKPKNRENLLQTTSARKRAKILFQKGTTDFVYGLLFHSSFQFHPSISLDKHTDNDDSSFVAHFPDNSNNDDISSSTANAKESTKMMISIVLHSRHSNTNDDGSQIGREIICLEKLLLPTKEKAMFSRTRNNATYYDGYYNCQVILLSDRPQTLLLLRRFLNSNFPNCIIKSANHTLGKSWRSEHGPFAGVGFYQDLKLVVDEVIPSSGVSLGGGSSNSSTTSASDAFSSNINTTVAFIGSKRRSSSQLIKELATYELLESIASEKVSIDTRSSRRYNQDLATCYLEEDQ